MEQLRIGTLVGAKDAVRVIPQIAPHGFESYSLTFGGSTEGMDLKEASKAIVELAAKHDAVISSIGVYGNPLTGTGDSEDTLTSWEQLIDSAHLFGTDIVTGFTGRLRDRPIDESIPRYKEVFGELSKRAADRGVRIAFENCSMGGNWWTGDWNIAHNPAAWEMMFDALPSDNIGLQWEPCHQMVSLIDPIPQLRKWVDKVFHVHGKDATIAWDVIKEQGIHGPKPYVWHRTPGFGDSNWSDIITILRQADYKGTIDIEGWHDPVYRDELEMTGQVHALNYLKHCRGGNFIPNPV
ncbi:sugar phosphate isomerase/epimerase [Paenibacillus anaericanus]|uniref:sugar phosphate isomerase/epimerase family protein n=1 Tax=Paenibacillus anaericanus TaxID=170367 RepID=UPI002782A5C0|nr:sugar phosphate isomerase/epimerase family protein [Paenibacillus anaericanus]MDQ0090173.1 sugar phosphate isomerase/epimerase [Paenibacillus anaericanus]